MKNIKSNVVLRGILLAVFTLYCLSSLTCYSSPGDLGISDGQGLRLVILNYHKIGNYNDFYSVSSKQFSEQVDYLFNNGYAVISLADFRSWRQGEIELPNKVFMLTFDDGNKSDYETVYPLIKERGLKGVFFLKTKAINTEGYLNAAQIKEMSGSGLCEFGSHSVTHRNVNTLSKKILNGELIDSRNTIQSITGKDVYAFAYPNGMWDEAAMEALMENDYQFAYTVMPGMNDLKTNPLELRRIIINRGVSHKIFVAWVERDEKLYKRYYSAMFKKASRDGLSAVAKLCEEELHK